MNINKKLKPSGQTHTFIAGFSFAVYNKGFLHKKYKYRLVKGNIGGLN